MKKSKCRFGRHARTPENRIRNGQPGGRCRACAILSKQRHRSSDKGKHHHREGMWRAQGMVGATYAQYHALFAAQGGACALCGRRPSRRALDWDHDHLTHQPRGLLCSRCNLMLGWLEAWGTRAHGYLAAWSNNQPEGDT
jgi:hypothetical protein